MIPDANSLDLTTGMTIEAWVRPSSSATSWRTILEKEASGSYSYSLRTDNNSRPQGRAMIGTNDAPASSGTALALNAWTHIAAIYDGTSVILYVNGAQVATKSRSGTITPSTGALRLGWSSTRPTELFAGQIDDVRVYDRALTQTEIQDDMAPAAGAAATIPASDGATESTASYDTEGNVTSRTTAPGAITAGQAHTVNYTYNADGSLATQEIRSYGATTPGDTYTYSYDTRGALKGIQYPGNVANSWRTYNAAGWLTGLYNRHGAMPTGPLLPDAAPSADANPIADYTYTYDAEGRKLEEQLRFDATGLQTRRYTYDSVGRLSTYTTPENLVREYRYDLDSNRIAILETPSGGAQTTVTTYAYDPGSITTPNGVDQLTSKVEAGQTTTFGYNLDGDLRLETRGAITIRDLTATGDWSGSGLLVAGTFTGTRVTTTLDPSGALKARGSGGRTTEYLGGTFERNGGQITQTIVGGAGGPLVQYPGAAPDAVKTYVFFTGHGEPGWV